MNRIVARSARPATAPKIERDPDLLAFFASDAAHVPDGFASGVAFPTDEAEVAAVVAAADRILPVGAQSSLTGGATPRGDVVLSARALTRVDEPHGGRVRVGAGVSVHDLQAFLAARELYYPPVPTFDGAFVGGTIATNAAGAATFKYGSTRDWVTAITVVLADGAVLDIRRGEVAASDAGEFEIRHWATISCVAIPTYSMPAVAKLSAGYFARPRMDLIDLFIGAEGTLGVVVDAEIRVIARPRRFLALVRCADDAQAIDLTAALRDDAHEAWAGRGPLDVSAIEYMDARALARITPEAWARVAPPWPNREGLWLLVQIEVQSDADLALERFDTVLTRSHIDQDPVIALPGDDRGAARLLDLRESVPSAVNAHIAGIKARVHSGVEKTAGDLVVPFDRLADSIAMYRRTFDAYGLDYAIWGHMSDGNLHPNVVPRSFEDVTRGREAILEMAHGVMQMGGAPLAEHGVGRSSLKQRLLRELYGDAGIEQMRAVKRALDPTSKLASGVLFCETAPPRG
jgi:D-lactate dehydrogenase (cytochrome)